MLFSATPTQKTDALARVSLKKRPMYVGVDDHKDAATVEGLEQVTIYHCQAFFVLILLFWGVALDLYM